MSSSTADFKPEEWTTSSNDALKLYITDSQGAVNIQPQFTYPIFGDAETIYGYKDLVIFLCFDHYTFYPFLNIKYSSKLNDEVIDIKKTMLEYLPESTIYKDEEKWADATKAEKQTYKIPGKSVASFTTDVDGESEEFNLYLIDMKSDAGRELHNRLQIMVLLFIEAGSYIDANDPHWEVYVLYSKPKDGEEPSICGFTTVYNHWRYEGAEKFDATTDVKVRKKISQFIVLPNWQGHHLGSSMYKQLVRQWVASPQVDQIVVEDPNEQFDDMRDRSDLEMLSDAVDLDKDVTPEAAVGWRDATRSRLKLEARQFARLIEMVLYKKYGDSKAVRLFIKRRLWQKNREGLVLMDEATRKDKLHTAYQALVDDYGRITKPVESVLTSAPPAKRAKTS
ncbi:histone acetyltransferase type B catalytic subunit [Diutina rugosa]